MRLFGAKNFEKSLDKFSEAMLTAPIKIEKKNESTSNGIFINTSFKPGLHLPAMLLAIIL
jgi:hypothetical protein